MIDASKLNLLLIYWFTGLLYLTIASKAIMHTPAFRGNKSVLTDDPPSGKMTIN